MKKYYLVLPILAGLSFSLGAQDSICLVFRSNPHLDSLRIENLSNGSEYKFIVADSIEIIFNTQENINTSSSINASQSADKEMLVYPNPCSGQARVEFTSTVSERGSLYLFDPAGKQVARMSTQLGPGDHCFSISLNQPGIHVLKLVSTSRVCSQALLNLDKGERNTGIEYSGFPESSTSKNGSFKSSPVEMETKNVIPAAKGDLLRFCGYSNSNMEMFYDFLTNDSTYEFTFPTIQAGVYLHINDSLAPELDTIHSFATREGYLFSFDSTGSVIFARERIQLQPVSCGGLRKPVYTWEINHKEVWMLDTSSYFSGELLPVSCKEDTSILTLHDLANNFSRRFVMIMVPDDFVANGIALTKIKNESTLDEISGMAASVKNPGCFWVHNDSGDEARLYLINTGGRIVAFVNMDTDHTDNRDWEDIAVGPGPVEGETYIYIGEIGDLDRKYSEKYIFRIVEPEFDLEEEYSVLFIPGSKIATITFDYQDGWRDAEILMIDPITKDLYIITKREDRVQIYELSYPQNYEEKIILDKSSVTLPFRMTNGGDISADGKEILVKNLTTVYYWKRKDGESVLEALSRPGQKLPYIKEPQGESIAWFRDGSAYLTVSEKKNGITPVLYLYKRRW